jgi:putative Holliday junction resolvase
MTKILGIDMGTKRIGLALSNEEATFAFPLKTLDIVQVTKNLQGIANQIGVIAHENAVKEIVIGESKTFAGADNPIMTHVHALKPMLEAQSFSVHLIPEFMTSAEATRHQGETVHVDASAAAIILQTFLDKKIMAGMQKHEASAA